MKKIIAVVMALVFALTVTAAFAQQPAAKPAEPAKKAEPAKPAEPAKKAEPAKPAEKPAKKEKVKQITGEVTAVDTVGKTITVKSKKQELTIGVTDEQIKDVKAGDKVVVKYTEKDGKLTAKSVKKVAPKAEKKGEVKKEEKKAEKPAEKKQ